MIQTILVSISIVAAVIAAAVLLYRRWTKPEDCKKWSGCGDCALQKQCEQQGKTLGR